MWFRFIGLRRRTRRTSLPPIAAATITFLFSHSMSMAASPTDWAGSRPIPPTASTFQTSQGAREVRRARPTSLLSTGDGNEGVWHLVAPPSGTPFFAPSLVYDSARNRLIAFGGEGSDYLDETWVFTIASGQWSLLPTVGTRPPARRLHGAVYDPSGDRLVIFGGWAEGLLDDVWQLTLSGTPTWSPLPATGSPGARAGFATVYDPANDRMVIFGGYDGVTPPLERTNDVWALSLGPSPAWTPITTSGTPPSPRFWLAAGFDPAAGALLVFGGNDGGLSNQLWKLTLGGTPTWTQVVAAGASPAPRTAHVGGYDPISHRFVVFGGYGEFAVLGDLWVIDPTSPSPQWLDVTPDPSIRARWGSGGVLTPSGAFYVVGGVNPSGRLEADVWRIQVDSPSEWVAVGDLYPYRLQEVMVMDPSRHRFIAFGGSDGVYRNDTYVHPLDTGRGWQYLQTSGTLPPARRLHTGIYDPNGDRLVVFGGFNDQLLGDLWQLTFSGVPTWSPLSAAGTPPSPRGGHVSIYDPEGQRMIVACGWDGVSGPAYRTGSTYALSLTGTPTWTRLADGPPRSSATAVYDEDHRSMVVFGGTDPNFLGDSWELSLDGASSWSQIGLPAGPAPREEHSAIYDSHRKRMVVFGGYDTPTPYSHNYDDLWALKLAGAPAWDPLAASGTAPSPRWGMKALYDPTLDGMWLYGGWDTHYSQQLFFLQWSNPHVPQAIATSSAEAFPDRADFHWTLPVPPRTTATVQRSTDGVNWSTVADHLVPGNVLSFTDQNVTPGAQYAWRSIVQSGEIEMVSSTTWLTIPSPVGLGQGPPAFSLRLAEGLARSSLGVWCSLPGNGSARVDLVDVMGRVRDSRDLSSLGVGRHRVTLGQNLESGVFFIRLMSGGERASVKGIVLN